MRNKHRDQHVFNLSSLAALPDDSKSYANRRRLHKANRSHSLMTHRQQTRLGEPPTWYIRWFIVGELSGGINENFPSIDVIIRPQLPTAGICILMGFLPVIYLKLGTCCCRQCKGPANVFDLTTQQQLKKCCSRSWEIRKRPKKRSSHFQRAQ